MVQGKSSGQNRLVLTFLIFSMFFSVSSSARTFVISDLGPQDLMGAPIDINDMSQVVFAKGIWRDGVMTDIGTLGGANTVHEGINSLGDIVGKSETGNGGVWHAFKWSAGIMQDIDIFDDGTDPAYSSSATAINSRGQMIYEVSTLGTTSSYILENGVATPIDSLFEGTVESVVVSDINEAGEVVGSTKSTYLDGDVVKRDDYGWIYSNGVVTKLPAIAGPTEGDISSSATALNNNNQVVGSSKYTFYEPVGSTLWNGVIPNLMNSSSDGDEVYDINDSGNAVGIEYTLRESQAYFYEAGVGPTSFSLLNPRGWWRLLERATAINNHNQVVGVGFSAYTGLQHVYMLTPVDESVTIDLATSISAVEQVFANEAVNYTVAVKNHGSNTASWLNADMRLYDPSTYYSIYNSDATINSVSSSHGNCVPDSGTIKLTCFIGELLPGDTALIDVSITYKFPGVIDFEVSSFSAQSEVSYADNYAIATVEFIQPPSADLSVTITDSVDPVIIGNQLQYDITVTNAGPDAANNVILSSSVPPGTALVSLSNTLGGCSVAETISCNLGTIPVGGNATMSMTVNVQEGGVITHTATVASDELEINASDNTYTETTDTVTVADVALTAVASTAKAYKDNPLNYQVYVANNGPSNATDVFLTLKTHEKWLFSSVITSAGDCVASDLSVTCRLGVVSAGNAVVIDLSGSVTGKPKRKQPVSFSAEVTSSTTDPDGANNSQLIETIYSRR